MLLMLIACMQYMYLAWIWSSMHRYPGVQFYCKNYNLCISTCDDDDSRWPGQSKNHNSTFTPCFTPTSRCHPHHPQSTAFPPHSPSAHGIRLDSHTQAAQYTKKWKDTHHYSHHQHQTTRLTLPHPGSHFCNILQLFINKIAAREDAYRRPL